MAGKTEEENIMHAAVNLWYGMPSVFEQLNSARNNLDELARRYDPRKPEQMEIVADSAIQNIAKAKEFLSHCETVLTKIIKDIEK